MEAVTPGGKDSREARTGRLLHLWRQLSHRRRDGGVGQSCLQGPGGRVPSAPFEPREEAAIQGAAVPGQAEDRRIALAEAHPLRLLVPRQAEQQSVEVRKDVVPIS